MESTTGGPRPAAATADARPTTGAAGEPAESTRREVSGGAHFAALDGYRALAALMVLLTHVATTTALSRQSTLGHVLARFDFGVPLFFLMSGFLLYRPWVRTALEGRARPDLRRYAVRRVGRIVPLYWVVVATTLLVLPEVRPASFTTWWTHLLAVQIYVGPGIAEGLSHTWSLCTEIAFYAALPIIGVVALGRRERSLEQAWRRQLTVLGILVLVSVAYNVVQALRGAAPFRESVWLPGFFDWFAAGMFLALVDVRRRHAGAPRLVIVTTALARDHASSLVLFLATFAVICTPIAGSYDFGQTSPLQSLVKHGLYLVAAFALLAPGILAADRGWPTLFARRWPRRVGLISYGIFLWHLMLLRILLHVLGIPVFSGRALELAVVLLAVTLVVATVTYRLVERPAQRWAHRL
ncbi:MAG TPA: acyltransferase [Candidatus Nanopelagicales bacterium]